MKIIHTADVHLGSKMDSRFGKDVSDERKKELRNTFKRLVEYAEANGVSVILLCGDVFDSNHPFKKDKDFFYGIVRNTPGIDFLYLRGNHDDDKIVDECPDNLKMFSESWTAYEYGNVMIYGAELCARNIKSYHSSLSLSKQNLNIVMLHGQVSDSEISIKKLKNKYIDYLALGHIHRPEEGKIDERGIYVYSGCLEGRGFDESGERGFVLIDTDGEKVSHVFVPFSERQINECDVDVTGVKDAHSAYVKVKDVVKFEKRHMYRINLVGEVDFDVDRLDDDVESMLRDKCYFVGVKDKTTKRIDIATFEKDLSIKGEFIRTVYADTTLSESDKVAVINYGLRALEGREIDV